MGFEDVKYDAFISYRHSEKDKLVATTIQKKLENFKLPKSLYGKTTNNKTKISRVFRDQDELPLSSNLSDPIQVALKNSEFLIVICTPRLPQSQWCAKEVETFIRMHGRDHVLVVLAEGEPEESFPPAVCHGEETVIDEQGREVTVSKNYEPLAAECRANGKSEFKKLTDDATVRLAAAILGLNYDDLKQRHREQKMKKVIRTAIGASAVFFAFSMICMLLALRINDQKNTISKQYSEIEAKSKEIEENNRAITAQNKEISAKNEEITAKNEEINKQYRAEQEKYARSMATAAGQLLDDGRKKDALYAVRNAMPGTKAGTDIPYSAEAERALSDALGIYNRDNVLTPINVYELSARPTHMLPSVDGSYIAVFDALDSCLVYNIESGAVTAEIGKVFAPDRTQWLDDGHLVYSESSALVLADVVSGEKKTLPQKAKNFSVNVKKGLVVTWEYDAQVNSIFARVYDKNGEKISEVPIVTDFEKKEDLKCVNLAINEAGTIAVLFSEESFFGLLDEKETYWISGIDLNAGTLLFEKKYEMYDVLGVEVSDSAVFILASLGEYMKDINHLSSSLLCLDTKTGEMIYDKVYHDIYHSKSNYINCKGGLLILDGNGFMSTVDPATGEIVTQAFYDDEMVNGSFILNGDEFLRMIVTDTGDTLIYDSQMDVIYEYSNKFYKRKSQKGVSDFAYANGDFFFAYETDNDVVHFSLTENLNGKNQIDLKTLLGGNYSGAKFSKDYRYAIVTETQNSGGEKQYTHTLYDIKKEEVLCKVTDSLEKVMFMPDNKGFICYKKQLRAYDFSGTLLDEITELDAFSNPIEGSDGETLIYSDYVKDVKWFVFAGNYKNYYELPKEYYNGTFYTLAKNEMVLVNGNGKLILLGKNSSQPLGSMDVDTSRSYSVSVSDDGMYMFLNYLNGSTEAYRLPDFSKVRTYYDANANFEDVQYIAALDSYLVRLKQGGRVLMNSDLEMYRDVWSCRGYDAQEGNFWMLEGSNIITIPYYTYEQLIEKTDEILKGYEPSEFIHDKYNM